VVFGLLCARFVHQGGLGTFADDSASYLIMAQVFSPWQGASAPVAEAFVREATYPPLYPLLLALAGSAHDLGRAHVLSALLLAACLPALYALARAWLDRPWAACAAALAFALLPVTWVQARGILSEPLFTLVFLAVLLALERAPKRTMLLAVLLAALVLTRAVGLVVVLAYGAWAAFQAGRGLRERARAALPAFVALAAYAAWVLLRPGEDHYVSSLRGHMALPALLGGLGRQAASMGEAWVGSLLLFWVEGRPLRMALAGAVGVAALAGMALRMRAGKADAWLVAAYLGTFLVYPFYDQMTRFLYPAVPVLLVYAFCAAQALLQALGRPTAVGHALVLLMVASLVAPALAFIAQRAAAQGPETAIIDWYRTPDLAQARSRSRVHLGLEEDMRAIATRVPPGERVMWVVPAYVALLADRRGVPAPPPSPTPEYRRSIEAARPDYLFLSRYHPRDTVRESAWRVGREATDGLGELVYVRRRDDGEAAAILLRLPAR
jgi:hypothetical protein